MNLFGRKTQLSAATASVAGENGEHQHDDVAAEINALEKAKDEDRTMQAAEALETYQLTPGAKSLIDRALDNISKNDGTQIEDPDFRLTVQSRAALINASGNDLSVAISAVVDSCGDDAKAISGIVYSICYNVLKNAVFAANLDYRRYLDPRADFDLTPYMRTKVEDEALGASDGSFESDERSEFRDAPPGLDSTIDREWMYFRDIYGSTVEITEDIFAASLDDVRIYLQLTVEAFGWDPERPMAFANVAEKDGTFTPITSAQQALDHTEVQRKLRMRERQAKDNARVLAAAERAKAALARAAKR